MLKKLPFLKETEIETNALSFGQKKLLLFAGMILKDPDVYLLDEPSVGLSDDFRAIFKDLVMMLQKRGKIIVIAEHNAYFDDVSDGVICLK